MIDIMKKWTVRHQDWGMIHAKLEVFFPNRVNRYRTNPDVKDRDERLVPPLTSKSVSIIMRIVGIGQSRPPLYILVSFCTGFGFYTKFGFEQKRVFAR